MDSTDFGESIRLTSAYIAATEYIEGNKTDEMDSKIRGGNSLLVDALVQRIGERSVLKNAKVKAIHQNATQVEVHLTSKRQFKADFCICAVPSHCLNKIKWKRRINRMQLSNFNIRGS